MFRIDTATAAGALPAPAAAGAPGYFTGGDPVHGVAPTTISPDWLNGIQEELIAILAAAGIAEAKGTNNQVLLALQALFVSSAGLGQSLTSNGYAKLPGGLIIQWGTGSQSGGSGSQAITFPIAFPNACLMGLASNSAGGAPTAFHGTGTITPTAMTIYSATSSGVAAGSGTAFRWIAVGF